MNLLFSCIGRRGYIADYFRPHLQRTDRIIGTSNTPWTSGFFYCDQNYVLPSISNELEYIRSVLAVSEKESVAAILSFYDLDVDCLARHGAEFAKRGIRLVLPNAKVSRLCLDKYATHQFLQQNHIRSPRSFIDYELARKAIQNNELNFPVIVKPRFGFASRNLFIAKNPAQLETFFQYENDMMIQELVKGEEYGFDIFNDFSGKVIQIMVKQKHAMRAGETDQATTIHHTTLLDVGVQLAEALKHVGPLDVDAFLDKNGKICVLELNPRFGGGYPVSHLAGADFPGLIVRMLKGETLTPDIGNYPPGVVMIKDYNILGEVPASNRFTNN
jgi:carbamoyl-phosphate synthase large subunit